MADRLNKFFRVNGFAGYLLLTPDNFATDHSPRIRDNHKILTVRQRDPIPVISLFHKATRYCLVSGIFKAETDLVHNRKIEIYRMVVKLFAVENIPQNHPFSEGKERNFSELITIKQLLYAEKHMLS
jgi:hypothetical protein